MAAGAGSASCQLAGSCPAAPPQLYQLLTSGISVMRPTAFLKQPVMSRDTLLMHKTGGDDVFHQPQSRQQRWMLHVTAPFLP